MSWLTDAEPTAGDGGPGAVDMVIEPGVKDLGGFRVRRALPSARRRLVGPFIFLDHMGPARFAPGQGIDVRPHPHIGLATLTYLMDGSILHRDTLGSSQEIVPGDVNWMTAGRGVAHSERSPQASRATAREMAGVQSWIALPRAHEETEPDFFHHAGSDLPRLRDSGTELRLIAGTAYGQTSPVRTFSHMVYADVSLVPNAALPLPAEHAERAVYVLDGELEIAGETHGAHVLLVFRPNDAITVRATRPSRLLLLGGEPMDGPRHIWWNFVHSSEDRIAQAKADWKARRFGVVPGDEREFIPLPD
jgi:redox-sensitive bicupin YhaK (pirin superfamily)